MSNVCIIPARGGSRRIPRKNIRDFMGRPIIAYSIYFARMSYLFDQVIVSTDDTDIANTAYNCGADYIFRVENFCEDEVGTQEVMRHVLGDQLENRYDYTCCIYATAPMISMRHFKEGYKHVQEETLAGQADYAMSVFEDENYCLKDPGQWYWGRVSSFLDSKPLEGNKTWRIIVPPDTACDINTEEDWARAERMYAKLHGIENYTSTAKI